ncbi:hypothetical protein [Petralouisia muris]|uniref:hypothetical protein n=1 Tax=Petralouisia muris TaxID=3032872 RepID=UPI0023B7FBD6|nr:hypothetical protein [Petralouisia muris]
MLAGVQFGVSLFAELFLRQVLPVASALENCDKEEQGFVYDIIRQNFLIGNSGSMTEEDGRRISCSA